MHALYHGAVAIVAVALVALSVTGLWLSRRAEQAEARARQSRKQAR